MKRLCTLASVAFVFSGSSIAAELTAEIPKDDVAFITKATTAAPSAIGQKATIVRVGDGFKLTPIRQGTNGWTCTVNTDGAPWCADANAVEWFVAISTQKEPPDKTGFVYMMAGDTGTSNHDPYATDKSHWVQTGPHVMIVGAAAREMEGMYPRAMDPDPSQAYVMFPGTPYAHLMLPVHSHQVAAK